MANHNLHSGHITSVHLIHVKKKQKNKKKQQQQQQTNKKS